MRNQPIRRNPRSILACSAHAAIEKLEERLALAVFTVLNTDDAGIGSLRDAITQANAAGTDTINFNLPLGGPHTISLLSALPQISSGGGALTITGPGANSLIVRRDPGAATNFRVFDSLSPTLSISGLTISGGNVPTARGGGLASGVNAQVTLDGVRLTGNTAQDGGAITIETGGFLTVRNSTISGNTASDDGGGIYFFNNGSLVMENSTVSGNTATADDGGGIYFYGTASAAPPSGFIASTVVVRNSTIHNNTCGSGGGGITLNNFTGTLLVQNSTITNNTANFAGSGVGGGIGRQSGTGTITIVSSIVSANTNFAAFEIGSSGTVNVNFSAIGSLAGFTLSGSSGNNVAVGIDLLLGPLADNGGPTQTRLPATGSAVVNAGSNPVPLTTDQRGAGFVRVYGTSADIGAVEMQTYVVTTAADSGAGSLREAITFANASAALPDTITFGGVFSGPQTISLMSALPTINDPLTITGTAARNLIIRRSPTAASNFPVLSSDTSVLNVANVTLSGGNASGLNVAGASPHVTLTGVILSGNSVGGSGGGILIDGGGFLTLRNSTVSGNTAGFRGGGIYFFSGGSLLMENSTVSGNTAGGSSGGGVYFFGTASATPPVGFTPNALVVRNSTIAGNNASSGLGGGISLITFTGTLLVQNSTITGNSAGGASGGGGISKSSASGTITLQSSIVSGNAHATAPDVFSFGANPVNANFSAIGSNAGFTLSGTSGNNRPFGANLRLSPLGNFGGPTQTIFPGLGSAALGTGSNSGGQTFDQRGIDRIGADGLVDIGAVETQGFTEVSNTDDSGTGSLRQAIALANIGSGPRAIAFTSSFFNTPRTITLFTPLDALTGEVTLFGPGANLLTVSRPFAAPNFRIFDSTASTLNMFGMTITGGNSGGGDGAGLNTAGTAPNVTLDGVVVTGNSGATNAGGINVGPGGFLTLRNSTVSFNSANFGGGIVLFNGGSIVVENSTVNNNSALAAFAGGGGLFLLGTASANPPIGFTPSTVVVRNSTIANNSSGFGGGIGTSSSFRETLLIQNSTITGNSASSGAGGIELGFDNKTLIIANSIVSGNTAGFAPDIRSAGSIPVTANFSAIGSNDGFTLSGSSSSNVPFGTNLMLGALGNNGGPTQTRRPLAGSPLLNAGSNALVPAALTTDQRGAAFPRILAGTVDIGAVESSTDFTPPTWTSFEFQFDLVGAPMRFLMGFSDNVQASLGADDIVLTNLTTATTIPTSSIAVTYNSGTNQAAFSFPGFSNGILPDGKYSFTLLASGVNDAAGNLFDADGNGTGGDNQTFSYPGTAFMFFLNGDATRDRNVNGADFNVLATNFGTSGKTFSQGNFSFDNLGAVNGADFNILASQFGKTLPGGGDGARPGGSRPGGGSSSLFDGSRRIGDDDDLGWPE